MDARLEQRPLISPNRESLYSGGVSVGAASLDPSSRASFGRSVWLEIYVDSAGSVDLCHGAGTCTTCGYPRYPATLPPSSSRPHYLGFLGSIESGKRIAFLLALISRHVSTGIGHAVRLDSGEWGLAAGDFIFISYF